MLLTWADSIGASKHAPVTAAATCHGDTAPSTPSRRRAAPAHPPRTSTASANPLGRLARYPRMRAASPAPSTPAGPAAPRSADAGTARLQPSAAPMTSTPSARRSRHTTHPAAHASPDSAHSGPAAAEAPQRRGRCVRGHDPMEPDHHSHGHNSSPAPSRRSTATGSVPTMTTGASQHQGTALPFRPRTGRAVALPNVVTVSPRRACR